MLKSEVFLSVFIVNDNIGLYDTVIECVQTVSFVIIIRLGRP